MKDKTEKALATEVEEVKEKVSKIESFGTPENFKTLSRRISNDEKWIHSHSAYEVPEGCIVESTIFVKDNVSTSLVFVPGVRVEPDENGGNKLVQKFSV